MAAFAFFLSSLEVALAYAPVTIALGLAFRVANYPDLTAEGAFMLAGACAVAVQNMSGNPLVSVAAGLLAGAMAGMLTAAAHTVFGVSKLLSGLITTAIAYSVALRVLGGRANAVMQDGSPLLRGEHTPSRVTIIAALLAVGTVIYLGIWWLFRSRAGKHLRAFGDSSRFAESLGTSPRIMIFLALSVSGALIGTAGSIQAHLNGAFDVNMAFGILVSGLASLVLGEAMFTTRSISAFFATCFVGTWFYCLAVGAFYFLTGNNRLSFFTESDVRLITGLILLGATTLTRRAPAKYRLFASEW